MVHPTGGTKSPGCVLPRRYEVARVRSPSAFSQWGTCVLPVGYEVARAEALGKPVLCLYRRVAGRRLSAMLAGNSTLRCEAYESVEALKPILEQFLRG